jgi:uroporphyrinogen decarboxylase
MRQAGRYLPEYRRLRDRHSFREAMTTPRLASEISLQPLRRFPLDAAIIFADIMTPLPAMGVRVEFTPGPRLDAMSLDEVAALSPPTPTSLDHVGETINLVREGVDPGVTVIGFAGAPATVLAYLMEGGGSQHFPRFRRALHLSNAAGALDSLSHATRSYLRLQVEAGAQVIQIFDTWAGLLSPGQFCELAVPAARHAIEGLGVPTIYFAPGATHLLQHFPEVGATGYGVDWRIPLGEAWQHLGNEAVIQGNLDPAVLLTNPATVRGAVEVLLEQAGGRPGHIFNLGHGILPTTPVECVSAMVDTVTGALMAGTT